MDCTAVLRRQILTRGEIARKHRQPYPNLPFLTSHHAGFMDHAEHVYGRRETWDAMLASRDSPTQHYPITFLLQGCQKLQQKIKKTEWMNRRFAERAKQADECTKKWMQEIVLNGVKCLEKWESPQRGPNEKFTKPEKKRKPDEAVDARSLSTDIDAETESEINDTPFLRMRKEENPSTLDPALASWPMKDSQRKPEVIEVSPDRGEVQDSSPEGQPKSAESSPRPIEKRKTPRTMKELFRQRPLFDANGVFKKHRGESYTKVDWETLRDASPTKGYDGKGAIERKVRLRRGEDV